MPKYTNASWGGETRVLENPYIRVEVHNRKTGWAYVEFFTAEGKMMGVLPYLASVQDNAGGPRGNMATFRRIEAQEVKEEHTESEDALIFDVHALTYAELVKGSFVEFMAPPEPTILTGTIRLTLPKDAPVLKLDYDMIWMGANGFVAMHGPWLMAGADSFGMHKTDGVFPGVEWLRTDEWSSNQNAMMWPLSDRTAVHPFKVAIPMMAVSHEGDTISLAWNPLKPILEKRPMQVEYYPQPVFSSPDAINHADQHLMGLMLPTAAMTHVENDPAPCAVRPFSRGSRIGFSAEIALGKGTSVDAIADYVKRHGLPEPGVPKKPLEEQLHYIAKQYDGHFFFEQKHSTGWGLRTVRDMIRQPGEEPKEVGVHIPKVFLERYIDRYAGTELAENLRMKLEKAKESLAKNGEDTANAHHDPFSMNGRSASELRAYGDGIMELQEADGSFPATLNDQRAATWRPVFINHWPLAENIYKAMSNEGDIVLENHVISALHLLKISEYTDDQKYLEAACKALDYAMPMLVADGGDAWETPIKAPNLLATGHAAIAYELAYRATGKEAYREKAIYWLRGLLVFTNLWEPKKRHMLYNTKPCFCVTDWATTSWVDAQVEWEVIEIFSQSREYGIDWAEVDPEIDWHKYEEGIACATTWWMLDASRADELPLDIDLGLGNLDGMFADQYDPVEGENL
ncbi:MAG: hypothetical protein K6A77_07980, partial [Clostridiales bacterium]|nr:hypothetical protein [Clostridiales bacterium]